MVEGGISVPATNTALALNSLYPLLFLYFYLFTIYLSMEPPNTPPQPVRRLLTRDKRLRIQLLKELSWKHAAITKYKNISLRQISWTVNHTHVTSQKKQKYGAKPLLNYTQVQALIQFISASRINRRISYYQVAAVLN
jgi:hypothetical protein